MNTKYPISQIILAARLYQEPFKEKDDPQITLNELLAMLKVRQEARKFTKEAENLYQLSQTKILQAQSLHEQQRQKVFGDD